MKLTRQVKRRIVELRIFPDPVSGTRSDVEIGRIVGLNDRVVGRFLRRAGDRAMRDLPVERVLELLDSEDPDDGGFI